MNNKNILISGAGIADVSLAFWLKKFGFNPTIVEVSPKLPEGAYAEVKRLLLSTAKSFFIGLTLWVKRL